MSYSRLTVVLTDSEMGQLRQAARQNVRRPRDQARYILLNALGIPTISNSAQGTDNDKSASVQVCETDDTTGAFVGVNP